MAISKKGLRKINVNGENFYWKIRKKISHNEAHNSEYRIPIQHENEGQILFIQVGFCRSYGYDLEPILTVTPSLIKQKIVEAINLGWQFQLKGNPVLISHNKSITELKKNKNFRLSAEVFL